MTFGGCTCRVYLICTNFCLTKYLDMKRTFLRIIRNGRSEEAARALIPPANTFCLMTSRMTNICCFPVGKEMENVILYRMFWCVTLKLFTNIAFSSSSFFENLKVILKENIVTISTWKLYLKNPKLEYWVDKMKYFYCSRNSFTLILNPIAY